MPGRSSPGAARQTGAEGAILTRPMRLEIHELEAGEGHRDHVGMATVVATSVVAWRDRHGHDAHGRPGGAVAGPSEHRAGAGTVVEGLGGMQMVLPLAGPRAR